MLLINKFPFMYQKYRNLRNRFFQYFPDNWIRSLKFSQLINEESPDIIIFSGGISDLSGWEFSSINKKNITTALLHGVKPSVGGTYYEKKYIHSFDLVVTNDPSHAQEWSKIGARKTEAVPYAGIHPPTHYDMKNVRDLPIVFVGTLFPDRQKDLITLVKAGLPLTIYGNIPLNVSLDTSLERVYVKEVWGDELAEVLNRSQIALNFVPDHMPNGGNLRTFEIPGCGAAQIANRVVEGWFEKDEIFIFDDINDLIIQLKNLLKDNDKTGLVALKAYKRTHKIYRYRDRFEYIINAISNTSS